jgi:small subunit ribosomal protein S2
MADQVSFKDLLGTGAHFGHVTRKWHPNYEPYILMERNGVHIINLEETVKHLSTAVDFIKKVVEKNGEILFVGTKKQARDIVQQEADRCGMFYVVERWLGGTLTNFTTIKKSIKRLKALEKEGSSIYENLTKKEIQMLNRERLKLSDQHRGIKDMRRLPDAIIIVDVDRETTALAEAIRLEIPVVALIDTNCDPRIVDYPIPANDDSIRTIQIIISAIVDSILEVKGELASTEEDLLEVVETKTTKEEVVKEVKVKETKPKEKVEVKAEDTKVVKKVAKDETPKVEKEVITSAKKVEDKPAVKETKKKTVTKTAAKVKTEKKTEKKADSTSKTSPSKTEKETK